MSTLLQDLRYGLRMMWKNRGFTAVAVGALALGIGANTALFSVVSGVLLHSLPYHEPERVVMLWEDGTERGGNVRVPVTPANFVDWREGNDVFTDLAASVNVSLTITGGDEPLEPLAHRVTANYFDVLGVEPLLGRTFEPHEGEPGNHLVTLLSYGVWQAGFGGDPDIIGSTVLLDDVAHTVIGVLRPDFFSIHTAAVQPGLWVPLILDGSRTARQNRGLAVFGRLAEGIDLDAAQAGMTTIAQRLEAEFPESNTDWGVRVVPVREDAVGSLRSTFAILLAGVGFVLLIACANVANLFLARTSERGREISLRTALGAGQARIVRQLLTESLLLAAIGGALGLSLAAVTVEPMVALIPSGAGVPFIENVQLDGRVLLFTLGVTALTGLLFGLAPARQAGRVDLVEDLKAGGRSHGSTCHGRRFRDGLVVVEVALALTLLTGAGIMLQSSQRLLGFEPGFEPERLLTLRKSLRGPAYDEGHERTRHFEELAKDLAAMPAVERASGISFPPPIAYFAPFNFSIVGEEVIEGHEPAAVSRVVLADYFETAGIPVGEGRGIDGRDRADSLPVAVINEVLARRYFGDREPVGSVLSLPPGTVNGAPMHPTELQIVGVVGNVKSIGMDPQPQPVIYLAHSQFSVPILTMVVRTPGDPLNIAQQAEATARGGGQTKVYNVQTLQQFIDSRLWRPRFSSQLLGAFALLALLLGAAGIYSVISYGVSQRTQEIGLRVALGAGRLDVLGMIIGQGLRLSLVGVGVGVVASIALSRLLAGLLFDISPTDPGTLVAVVGLLLVVTIAACSLPALRATRVDPMVTLREE